MSMQTLLITGGTGYVGQSLITQSRQWRMHATYRQTAPSSTAAIFHRCDLRDERQVGALIQSVRPDVIIHTAGSNRGATNMETIVPAARHLARFASIHQVRLIHLSSDMVFDGFHPPYTEQDPPSPITPYGRAKADAERVFLEHCPDALIIRTSLIYGTDPPDHMSQWLLHGIEKGQPVPLFTDERRCPIWIQTLVQALFELADSNVSGILHVVGPEAMNRWDIGQALLGIWGYANHPLLKPSTCVEENMVRPKDLDLSTEKARSLLKTPLLSLPEVIRRLSQQAEYPMGKVQHGAAGT